MGAPKANGVVKKPRKKLIQPLKAMAPNRQCLINSRFQSARVPVHVLESGNTPHKPHRMDALREALAPPRPPAGGARR